jgi:hypothetical protein
MVPLMPVSFVLRLVPTALAESKIVGQVQEVETGEVGQLRNAEELITFLLTHAHGPRSGPAEEEG